MMPGPIVRRVQQLKADNPDCFVVVDAEGLGDAVWELLDQPRRPGWRLYQKHGPEREELTRVLLVAVERRSFGFASGRGAGNEEGPRWPHPQPREDGPGSELAVALSLAIDDHRPPAPRIW